MALHDYFDIGDGIKKIRKENGLSQKELAEILGIPVTTLSGYERNMREIPKDVLESLLDTFDLSFSDFVGIPKPDKYHSFLNRCRSLGLYVQSEHLPDGYCRIGFYSHGGAGLECFAVSLAQLDAIISMNDSLLITFLKKYLSSDEWRREYADFLNQRLETSQVDDSCFVNQAGKDSQGKDDTN